MGRARVRVHPGFRVAGEIEEIGVGES
jgi:hypothetical protein